MTLLLALFGQIWRQTTMAASGLPEGLQAVVPVALTPTCGYAV